MQTLRDLLNEAARAAFAAAGVDARFGEMLPSQRPDLGQFQCNGALAAAKEAKRPPRDLATAVLAVLSKDPRVQSMSIAGPGFLNLTLKDDFLAAHAEAMAADPRHGCPQVLDPKHHVVDFGGPNVAKAMHVGHLRSSIIGECLKRVLRFAGHRVTGDIHLGDWGTQMGMLVCEVERRLPALPYFAPGAKGPFPKESPVTIDDLGELYPVAAARCKEDPAAAEAARKATFELQAGRPGYRALWQHFVDVSVAALKKNFEALGVSFDLWLGESSVQDKIPPMIEKLRQQGFAVESEGALVVPVAEPGDTSEVPPLILQKTDGAVMYGTTDLATIDQRVAALGAEVVIYVVDKRQALHFEQVFRAARKSGIAGGCLLDHAGFGTMNGPDGKPFKTRAGGVMKLEDLIAMAEESALARLREAHLAEDLPDDARAKIARQVGIATIKFADLQHQRTSDYVFQLEKFTSFDGYTGPYLQYTAVRMRSLLRKVAEAGHVAGPIATPSDVERDLILQLARLPDVIDSTITQRAPSFLCEHVYELCRRYSRFYESSPVLKEPDPSLRSSRIRLTSLTLHHVTLILTLLGIEIPERL